MKSNDLVITVKFVELTAAESAQIQRSGFMIYKSGAAFRVKVGDHLLAKSQAVVTVEVSDDDSSQKREAKT